MKCSCQCCRLDITEIEAALTGLETRDGREWERDVSTTYRNEYRIVGEVD